MLLLLLSLGTGRPAGETKEGAITVVNLEAEAVSEPVAEPSQPEARQSAPTEDVPPPPPAEELPPVRPVPPIPAPAAPSAPPRPAEPAPPATPRSDSRPAPPARPLYGPSDRFRPSASRDSERVGTAPNGEPLYAAAWYREPSDLMLSNYLSTATGSGWGLIACQTAPNYRVENCVPIAEYPEGSQINRALLAAAWEFRVRPPQLGGRPLIGSWVRIRIDYQRR